jgi:hypothetical protein
MPLVEYTLDKDDRMTVLNKTAGHLGRHQIIYGIDSGLKQHLIPAKTGLITPYPMDVNFPLPQQVGAGPACSTFVGEIPVSVVPPVPWSLSTLSQSVGACIQFDIYIHRCHYHVLKHRFLFKDADFLRIRQGER